VGAVYWLARENLVTLTGVSEGILFVLVMGAGTDYALLLISRYREELHRHASRFAAMWAAWRQAAPPVVASAVTVAIAVLCLSLSKLGSNRGLGPVAAVGIGSTLLAMLVLLPVALALAGRWVFWPRVPRHDETVDPASVHGVWARIAGTILRRKRVSWVAATLLLLIGVAGVGALNTGGLPIENGFTGHPAAMVGQGIYDAEFSQGAGAPAIVVTDATAVDAVMRTARAVRGVAAGADAVCPQLDLIKARSHVLELLGSRGSCPPAALTVAPIDGRTVVDVTFADAYDSPAALATVQRLRTAVHAIPAANALVTGDTAVTWDVKQAAARDNRVIIPVVLAVIFTVLVLLLRAVVAPLLLIGSVVLSFAATLGVCGVMFAHVFHFAGADESFPLFAFVFLVALGIDYNIFLMTRVREEALRHGTGIGLLRGLTVTGGVITSAGAVLAATFGVLGLVSLVFLVEVGFAVAFGVLVDTVLVRTVLVPALAADIGRPIWWPTSRIGR
jgi:putative drug exporter of the RND superfamily